MKKLIQICTILSLAVIFTVASAQAQTSKKYDAQIPFEFSIGQKTFAAGTYVIRITRISPSATSLALEDKDGNQVQTQYVLTSGDVLRGNSKIIFNRYENHVFLAKILTPEKGFTVPMSGAERQVAREQREKGAKTQVAIALPAK